MVFNCPWLGGAYEPPTCVHALLYTIFLNTHEFSNTGLSLSIPYVTVLQRRALCDALLGVLVSPLKLTKCDNLAMRLT